jgi:hypothetical protein
MKDSRKDSIRDTIGRMNHKADQSAEIPDIPSDDELMTRGVIFNAVKSETMPWAILVYLSLFGMFLLLLLVAFFSSRHAGVLPDSDPAVKLFSFASDGLKTVLGALLGSLSLATEYFFRKAPRGKGGKQAT